MQAEIKAHRDKVASENKFQMKISATTRSLNWLIHDLDKEHATTFLLQYSFFYCIVLKIYQQEILV